MGIFAKNNNKETSSATTAPEEPETSAEENYVEELSSSKIEEPIVKPVKEVKKVETPEVQIREVPVCMSQAQIYNLIIENNIILKQIISNMDN